MGKALKIAAAVVGVALIIFAPYLAPVLLPAALAKVAIATALLTAALTIAGAGLLLASGALAPKPSSAVGPPSMFRQSIANSFIVYGKRRVGGLMVFFHPKKVGKTHYRYFAFAIAGHHCNGLVSFMLNDETVTVNGSNMVTSGTYANAAWLWFQEGNASETANSTFTSECGGKWTSDHKGNGVAALYAKFEMTDDVVQAGMPNITVIVEGRDEIYDYRDDTTGYTRNAILCFYDWMLMPREEGGFGAYDDEIPDAELISAWANVCDETVESEERYAIDALITTGAQPAAVRDTFVVNMAGTYTYSGGVHLCRPGYWVPVSDYLGEDDLAGPIRVSSFLPGDQAANEVQGTFVDPDAGYQGAPFATQTSDPAPADIRQADLELAFVTSKYRGERIARIMLNRALAEKSVTWPMNVAGLKVAAMSTVQLDTTRYGLNNYAWVVSQWEMAADFSVVLGLREEGPEIYEAPSPVSASSPATIATAELVRDSVERQLIIRNAYPSGASISAADVGADATITIGAHTHVYPGTSLGAVSVSGGTVTGLAFSTAYFVYCDLDDIGDTSPTYGATTTYADALNSITNPDRMFLNQSITTPADGAGGTSGGGAGGGYGGGGQIP